MSDQPQPYNFFAPPSSPLSPNKRIKRCGTICIKYIFGVPHMLVVRGKQSHIWSLPKGCININETEVECAQRETLEETGLNIQIKSSNPRVNINHNVYFVITILNHPKLRIRDKAEVDKVNWMSLAEIKMMECNKDLRSILSYPERKYSFHSVLRDFLKLDSFAHEMRQNRRLNTVNNSVNIANTANHFGSQQQFFNVAHDFFINPSWLSFLYSTIPAYNSLFCASSSNNNHQIRAREVPECENFLSYGPPPGLSVIST